MPDWAIQISYAILGVSLALTTWRVAHGPSLPDRVVALDLFAYIVVALAVLHAIQTDQSLYLMPAIVLALLMFIGTVAFASFIERSSQS